MKSSVRQFYIASMIIFMCYGIAAQRYGFFPAPQLQFLLSQAKLAMGVVVDSTKWYYLDAPDRVKVPVYESSKTQPGLTLITGIGEDNMLRIKVIEPNGDTVHQWNLDWYEMWPDATHIPTNQIPRGNPGTHIHGSKLMDNGDILFNYENLGLVRVDACGNTQFRLAYPTHHSVNFDDSGDIWLPGQVNYTQKREGYESFEPPFKDDTIARVSPEGELLEDFSVMDLLRLNGYEGLMFMSSLSSRNPRPTGDLFHLNDVEIFPKSMTQGVFKHGDVMISLRNINTVLVYDPKSYKIRFISSGQFVRQHDPDFIDGNTISVYDNNHLPGVKNKFSQIVYVSALDGGVTPVFAGSSDIPFYSKIMGKHQWLDNGNLLALESMNGRVIELSPEFEVVWSFNNLIEGESKVGIMEGAERLAAKFDKAFFAERTRVCAN